MRIPIKFDMYQKARQTFYTVHIEMGKREYKARLCGEDALETIADDILRLTVIAQVQHPEYHIDSPSDVVIDPAREHAESKLIAMLHDTERIQQAYNHVKNPPGTNIRTPILPHPPTIRYD